MRQSLQMDQCCQCCGNLYTFALLHERRQSTCWARCKPCLESRCKQLLLVVTVVEALTVTYKNGRTWSVGPGSAMQEPIDDVSRLKFRCCAIRAVALSTLLGRSRVPALLSQLEQIWCSGSGPAAAMSCNSIVQVGANEPLRVKKALKRLTTV